MIKIAIITSLYNGSTTILNLINSINIQSEHINEWIVVDNFSSDDSAKLIKKYSKVNLKYFQKKTSIYEAMNYAIKKCDSSHYLVLGADDELTESSLISFNKKYSHLNEKIFIFDVQMNNIKKSGFFPKNSFLGASKVVNSHSAGMIIPTKIHRYLGYYRTDLKICSDSDIILKIINSKFKTEYVPIVLGKFSTNGISNKNTYLVLKENYSVMIDNKFNIIIQTFIFILRIIKNLDKILLK